MKKDLMMTVQEWEQTAPEEQENLLFSFLGITRRQVAEMIAEHEFETRKRPNAIFVSLDTLAEIIGRLPLKRVKEILGLKVIPIEGQPRDHFTVSLVDPDDWGNLFFS